MTITLITGATKGLGHETARRLIDHGHTVIVGARDEVAGRAVAEKLGARFVKVDVTDDASVAAAAAEVASKEGAIDVLINNAGVFEPSVGPEALTGPDVSAVFDVNVVGVVRTTTAFIPLLRRSADPVIINVSSGMGSLEMTHDPARPESYIVPAYAASKAALTMLTTQYARAFPDIRVNAADPGYTATDFNGNTGTQTVTEGTDAIVQLATEGPGHASGRVVDRFGELSWGRKS